MTDIMIDGTIYKETYNDKLGDFIPGAKEHFADRFFQNSKSKYQINYPER